MSIFGRILFPSSTSVSGWKNFIPALERIRAGKPEAGVESHIAEAVEAIKSELGMKPFDVQLLGALAMANLNLAEMQTGEGKTLTAVMTAYAFTRQHGTVHVLTANDYLAQRDAEWMGPVYRKLGLSVAWLTQSMAAGERKAAYGADVLYATANEIGFDYLRDGLVLQSADKVQPPFCSCLIDEADSILIDEARVPLVIAAGTAVPESMVRQLAQLAAQLREGLHFTMDEYRRNILLTPQGAQIIETASGCPNLYEPQHHCLLESAVNAIHAQTLLRRDVDYIVRDGLVEVVDEFKGRIAEQRRWPAALQSALEAKEGVPVRLQGRIVGQLTLESLLGMYPVKCGMTGTAATQADEFLKVYKLEVVAIPPNRPMIRVDHPDVVFASKREKEEAVAWEIRVAHTKGRPVLVGSASIAESERISALVTALGIPHVVLNAKQDEAEARIIEQAGRCGAVTISTNLAGRGTDIKLWPGAAELGGLYVIGTNRHEARRIDFQLRGRAGRQGDPGESRFFVSQEDDLMVRYGLRQSGDFEHIQRVVEGQNLDARKMLWKYEGLTEQHRRDVRAWRDSVLDGDDDERRRLLTLEKIDEAWSDYLAQVTDLREGIHWVSWGGKDPLNEYLFQVTGFFEAMEEWVESEVERRLAEPHMDEEPLFDRSSTWVYIVNDQPWGTFGARWAKGVMRYMGVKKD